MLFVVKSVWLLFRVTNSTFEFVWSYLCVKDRTSPVAAVEVVESAKPFLDAL